MHVSYSQEPMDMLLCTAKGTLQMGLNEECVSGKIIVDYLGDRLEM